MVDAKIFLINYFKKKTGLKNERALAGDYFKSGLIDSLQFIEMINDIENKFKISFSSEELESDAFRTINGLAGIINRLRISKQSYYAKNKL